MTGHSETSTGLDRDLILAVFSAPPDRQIPCFPDLPRDIGSPDFFVGLPRNPLLSFSLCGFEYLSDPPETESAGSAPAVPEEMDRLGAARDDLFWALTKLDGQHYDLWCARGLEREPAWRVVRILSKNFLVALGNHRELGAAEIPVVREAVQRWRIKHYRKYWCGFFAEE